MTYPDDNNPLWDKFRIRLAGDPDLWMLMQRFSFEAISSGRKHYSARTIFERIRWHVQIETGDPDFKINDHWPPYYSRAFMWAHPQYGPTCWQGDKPLQRPWGVRKPATNDGFFELRVVDTNLVIEQQIYTWFESQRNGH